MRTEIGVIVACSFLGGILIAEPPDPSRLVDHAGFNEYRALRTLLEAGVRPDSVVAANGESALIVASRMGYPSCVELLVGHGADTEFGPPGQDTPLVAASLNGRVDSARLLLKAGADVNKPGRFDNWTPLFAAAVQGHSTVGTLLIAHGADIDAAVHSGATPLLVSACNGHKEMVILLLSAGANVDWQDNRGNTPLICAVTHGYGTIARLLLDSSANPNFVNNDGVCAWAAAVKKNDTSTLAALRRAGARECKSPRK